MAKSSSSEELTVFEKFSHFMEHNTRGVEIGIYATSGLLFAVAYYKIRPITKFGRPRDIPRHFVRNKLPQKGTVERIEASLDGPYPTVIVNHKPLFNLFFASKKRLPIKVAGIEINSNGYSWLQSVIVNKDVNFVPIDREGTVAQCKLFVVQPDGRPPLDVAKALLSIGFAKLELPRVQEWDEKLLDYYELLVLEEKRAKKKRAGLWQFILPQPSIARRLFNNVYEQIASRVLPPAKRLPDLVR